MKLQKHLKIVWGEQKLLKIGKTCEAVSEQDFLIKNLAMYRKLHINDEKIHNYFGSLNRL